MFLEVMNWYDGIVIDKIWVGYSKFWLLPGCEDIPYVQTWKQMLNRITGNAVDKYISYRRRYLNVVGSIPLVHRCFTLGNG